MVPQTTVATSSQWPRPRRAGPARLGTRASRALCAPDSRERDAMPQPWLCVPEGGPVTQAKQKKVPLKNTHISQFRGKPTGLVLRYGVLERPVLPHVHRRQQERAGMRCRRRGDRSLLLQR